MFVVVSRVDPGAIKVNPKDFYGLFSDPSHSRFTFVDKAAELEWQGGPQPPSSGNPNGNAQASGGSPRGQHRRTSAGRRRSPSRRAW